jgi:superfamily II DNA/RNA helicase
MMTAWKTDRFNKFPDILLESPTGSGKTIAYLKPIIDSLPTLVVAPTRELARQIQTVASSLSDSPSTLLVANQPVDDFSSKLIIGTPGGILTHLDKIPPVSVVVLDEIDRLLDFGFLGQMGKIFFKFEKFNLIAVSATVPQRTMVILNRILRPGWVHVTDGGGTMEFPPPIISHQLVEYEPRNFFSQLLNFSKCTDTATVVVFPTTRALLFFYAVAKRHVANISALHGRMTDAKRQAVVEKFRTTNGVLFCTDIFARGIDVPQIGRVVHVGLSGGEDAVSQFVHRSGRTARGIGGSGESVFMVGKNLDSETENVKSVIDSISWQKNITLPDTQSPSFVDPEHRSYKYQRHLSSKCLESLLSFHSERRGVKRDRLVKSVIDMVRSSGIPQPSISEHLARKLKIDHIPGLIIRKSRKDR